MNGYLICADFGLQSPESRTHVAFVLAGLTGLTFTLPEFAV